MSPFKRRRRDPRPPVDPTVEPKPLRSLHDAHAPRLPEPQRFPEPEPFHPSEPFPEPPPYRLPSPEPPPSLPPPIPESEDRDRLIAACIEVIDETRSDATRERLLQALDEVGVLALRPDGERFTPQAHTAVQTIETDDPQRDGLVAGTERLGFTDGTRLLRRADVAVYRTASG